MKVKIEFVRYVPRTRQGNRSYRVWIDGKRVARYRCGKDSYASRPIYATRDTIVKIGDSGFNRGQNIREAARFRKYADTGLVPRVLGVCPKGTWLAVERIRGLQQAGAKRWPKSWKLIRALARKMSLRDVCEAGNWGVVRGRPILYDAGL